MRKVRQGMALMTALLFITFLLVVGLAFLTMVSNDYAFGRQQEHRRQAYLLAESGMEYYRQRSAKFIPSAGGTPNQTIEIPLGDPDHVVEIDRDTVNGTVTAKGILYHAGKVLATRTLVAPNGDFGLQYDADQN